MLRKVWLTIRVEKVNIYERVIVKVLLDSGATGIFIDRKMAAKHGFRLQKLNRSVTVKNVDSINNSAEAITYQVEVNVYYKNHVKRIRMDVCNLGKIDIILGMPWIQVYNLEINWKTEEVKITRCPPICRRNTAVKKNVKQRKKIGKRIRAIDQANRDE